ncbi:lipase/acyltransferase domain-containing protein [Paenibacillus elgii]|uniref:lipase/acyltransferase domain-containing protein n=1 Tax=Paenibacillus elgii TaxID=189691 RepID=UPI000FDBE34E|nr:hypothetical protein [Paenibacillus elgii]NEN87045.1 hypothetical protein [Paenibacillus elgii]
MRQIIFLPGIMGSGLKKDLFPIWPSYIPYSNKMLDSVYQQLTNIDDSEIKASFIEPLVYTKILKNLSNYGKVTPVPYDWRLNNLEHISLLAGSILEKAEEVIIVAHSMGGIVARLFINSDDPEFKDAKSKVTKLITLATPWNGSPTAYKTLKYGNGVPSDSNQLVLTVETSKKIAPYFPSIYQLLPSSNYNHLYMSKHGFSCLKDKNEKVYDWSLLREKYYPLLNSRDHDFTNVLDEFYEKLSSPAENEVEVEHYEILAYGTETLCSIEENNLNEPEGIFGEGDGTVPIISAMSASQNKYFIKSSHQKIVREELALKIIGNILDGVPNEEIDGVYRQYNQIAGLGFSGKIIKVACPVIVSLTDEEGNVLFGNIGILDEDFLKELLDERQKYNVTSLGSTTYIIMQGINKEEHVKQPHNDVNQLPANTIFIEAYDQGPTSVSIEEYEEGKRKKVKAFSTFNINKGKSAKLNIADDLVEMKLLVNKDKDLIVEVPSIIENVKTEEDKNIILPKTIYTIESNSEKIISEDSMVVPIDVQLNVKEVIPGTYDYDSTYICLNNNKYDQIENFGIIPLEWKVNNFNTLKIFSKDILGNTEEVHTEKVFVSDGALPKIVINFYLDYYEVEKKYDEIQKVFAIKGVKPSSQKVIIPNQEGVTGEVILYRNKERIIKVEQIDIFGNKNTREFYIDETLIQNIFQGIATPENIFELLTQVGLENPMDITIKKRNGFTAKSLKTEHIQNARYICISNERFELHFFNGAQYYVSFFLKEDINVIEENKYCVKLSIIEIKTRKEITTKKLNAFFKVSINTEHYRSEDLELTFDENEGLYVCNFDLEELKKFLDEFWEKDMHNLDIIVTDQDKGNMIETKTIKIR